jgi:hypothetical protein
MLVLLIAAAAAQGPLITRMPPVLPGPMQVVEPRLPDLVIPEIRVLGESRIEIEILNRGRSATPPSVRMHACIHARAGPGAGRGRVYCSADRIVGRLAAGHSRRVVIDCFYKAGRLAPGVTGESKGSRRSYVPPVCDNADVGLEIARYSATVDPDVWPHADPRQALAAALKRRECAYGFGCIRELDEKNNSRELVLSPSG